MMHSMVTAQCATLFVRFAWLGLALAGWIGGCSTTSPCHPGEDRTDRQLHSVFVVRRDWHTGIAMRARDWPNPSWPILADFPRATYLEFGWGDAVYYQAEKKTLAMTLRAVLWPTPGVMEVRGLDDLSMRQRPNYEIVELHVSHAGLLRLSASIADSFGEHITPTGTIFSGADGTSWFYHARGNFYFPNMCNRWTARQLQAAGYSIQAASVVAASRVMREARAFSAATCDHSSRVLLPVPKHARESARQSPCYLL